MDNDERIKILFVCMGNICRSPTADAVFRHHVNIAGLDHALLVDSAGTHAYHIGNPPDERALRAALQRGYKMHDLRARTVQDEDFVNFDYILAMDKDNLAELNYRCPDRFGHKLALFMKYSPNFSVCTEVADPYYGGNQGFENVLDMVESASQGLLAHIRAQL